MQCPYLFNQRRCGARHHGGALLGRQDAGGSQHLEQAHAGKVHPGYLVHERHAECGPEAPCQLPLGLFCQVLQGSHHALGPGHLTAVLFMFS